MEPTKEELEGRDMIRCMPNNITFCAEDLEEIFSQD